MTDQDYETQNMLIYAVRWWCSFAFHDVIKRLMLTCFSQQGNHKKELVLMCSFVFECEFLAQA